MRSDKQAQITVRDLHKMTKREARSFIKWLRGRADMLEEDVEEAWLVLRKQYAPLFHMSLMIQSPRCRVNEKCIRPAK